MGIRNPRIEDLAKGLPDGAYPLLQLADWVGTALVIAGAEVTDIGYSVPDKRAETVVVLLGGDRIELTVRRL